MSKISTVLSLAPLALAGTGCTIMSVDGGDQPPRLESNGLIEGHAAVGIREEHDFIRLKLLDGESDGAVGELVLWKLLRLEVGLLGLGVGVGPFDLALGTVFYEPRVPRFEDRPAKEHEPAPEPADDTSEVP